MPLRGQPEVFHVGQVALQRKQLAADRPSRGRTAGGDQVLGFEHAHAGNEATGLRG